MAESISPGHGLHLVDIELAGSPRRTVVRVFIDKPGGVTLQDCERFSRALSAALDVEDVIRTAYVLEVSSPGLDRPLRRLQDFMLNIGKLARVSIREKIDEQSFFIGRITEVDGNTIRLILEDSKEVLIPFEQISKARLEIEIR